MLLSGGLMPLPIDKQAHFLAGMAIACFCVAYSMSPWTAFLFTAFVGAAKEVWDQASGAGTMDLWDFVATAAGAAVVLPLEVI